MIEVSGISKRYGAIDALRNVSFTVQQGQIVGFLGANGAGKTTTMDILCGCIGADQGNALVCGNEITAQPKDAKRKLGYLPDEPPLHNDMKVEDFIAYAARLRGLTAEEIKIRVPQVIDRLSLHEVKGRLIGNLSKGFRQRVGLAQALVHNPEVLILDEPTEGLDPNQIVQIRDLIRSLKGEHTILFSSHILSEVQSICDEIIIIDKGQVVAQGPYETLVKRLQSGHLYCLRVHDNPDKALEVLRAVDGVSDVRLSSSGRNTLEFRCTQEDVIERAARAVLDASLGLRELSLRSKSLEDVFFQLTQHTEAQGV